MRVLRLVISLSLLLCGLLLAACGEDLLEGESSVSQQALDDDSSDDGSDSDGYEPEIVTEWTRYEVDDFVYVVPNQDDEDDSSDDDSSDDDSDGEEITLSPSCALGSPFHFFAAGGTVNRLLVVLQGGGSCWGPMTCLYVPIYEQEIRVTTERLNLGPGILDRTNPHNPFREWSIVYIPYCTGDLHWGAQDTDYDGYTIQHRGWVNAMAVGDWIQRTFSKPKHIFVTGESAGGFGAAGLFSWMADAYGGSRVDVLVDSGNLSTDIFDHQFQDEVQKWNIQPPTVLNSEGNVGVALFQMASQHRRSRVGLYSSTEDALMSWFINVVRSPENPENWGWYNPPLPPYPRYCDFHNQLMDSIAVASDAPNFRHYIAAGRDHTILGDVIETGIPADDFYSEASAGEPFSDWVGAMVRGNGQWRNRSCEECLYTCDCNDDGDQCTY